MQFRQALHDLRAFRLLEQLAGREAVQKLIERAAPDGLTMAKYPHDDAFLPNLRVAVNAEIEKYLNK